MRFSGRARADRQPAVHRITAARRTHQEDQDSRMLRYTVSMSIRMVCIVLALVTSGLLQWICIAGAVVLPYVAVLLANASREQTLPPPDTWDVRQALGPPPRPPEDDEHR